MTPRERLAIASQLANFRRESEQLQNAPSSPPPTGRPAGEEALAQRREQLISGALAFEWAAELLADLLRSNGRSIQDARDEVREALRVVEKDLVRAATPHQVALAEARRRPIVMLASFLSALGESA